MNLTLIGMPGSGKSYIGSLLAERLGYRFLDIDREIEKQFEGATLQEILEDIGDKEFKELEEKAVRELTENEDNLVISPGGSIVYSEDIMDYLGSISTVAFLEAPLALIEERIGQEPRGIVGFPEKTLSQIFKERAPLYKKYADETFNAAHAPDELVEEISLIAEKDRY